MARGKILSTEEKIERINTQIADIAQKKEEQNQKFNEQITKLQAEAKNLIEKQKQKKLNFLLEKIEEKGLSVDDVLAKL